MAQERFIGTGSAIVGGGLAAAGNIIGSNAAKEDRKKQEALVRQKQGLYGKLAASNLKKASKNFKQTHGANILGQSISGIDLNSPTFQALNNQAYRDYLEDVENINLQSEFYNLGIESEIAGINAQKPTTFQQGLSFLSSAAGGANAGFQFGNQFSSPKAISDIGNFKIPGNNFKPVSTTLF